MSNKPHRPFAASQGLVLTSTCADTTYTNVPSGGESLLSRKSSGIYDNFACVRVGDYDLPSSMDLRQYLDEMQEVGHWEEDADLPTIPDVEVGCHPCPTPPPPPHPPPVPPFSPASTVCSCLLMFWRWSYSTVSLPCTRRKPIMYPQQGCHCCPALASETYLCLVVNSACTSAG